MGGVFGVLILFGSYMAGVICLAEVQPASLTGISNVSAILGFLIVFRFNQVYVMFSKSRTHVGELLSSIRKVALHVNSMWRGNLSLDERGRARTFKEVDRLYHHNHGSVHPERTHAWMRQHGEDNGQKAADRPRRRGAAAQSENVFETDATQPKSHNDGSVDFSNPISGAKSLLRRLSKDETKGDLSQPLASNDFGDGGQPTSGSGQNGAGPEVVEVVVG